MLKSLREKLCCGKPDTADDHEQISHPVEVPHKAYSQIETTPTPSNVKPKIATVENPVKRDLWKEAFTGLPDDRKRYLMVKEGCSTVDVINDVIKTTEQKYKEWKEGGLKIRRRNGNDFDVRDSAEKILHCAFQARDLISKAVSLDPTGHASAAWSIVSVGLTMIHNDIQRRDAVFAASEYLADTLAYYTSIDTHHRDQNIDSDQNLDNALLGVYSAILDYSAEVNKVQEQNAVVRVGMSINAIADQPLEQLKAHVKEKGQSVDNWAYLSDSRHNRKKAEDTLANIDQCIAINKHIESKVLTAEEERILEWISTADYSRIQKETKEFRSPKTHNWFLTSNQYQYWKDSPGHILWLCGVVGCGKSVLCSTVIQDIKSLCEESSSKSFAYWYFQFNNEKTRSVENMVRSLIRQFSRKPLAQSVTRMWERHSNRGSQPDRGELRDTLDDVLSKTPGEMFLVLDALDECPERSGRSERKVLLSLLAGLNESHKNKLHILATSRPEQDIRATLERFPTVDLEAQLSDDVETFVRTEVSNGRLRDFEESKRARALDQLLRTRDRRFRWADLQLTRLAGCHTDLQIEHALRTIPETLEETYREVLDKVEEKDINIAREILLLLCLAPVPLNIRTIADAVSLRSPDLIVKICTTALVIVSTDGAIRLAHFSVKEYLVVSESSDQYRFSETKGHHELAIKTINLLLSQNETLAAEVAMAQPFLVYAAKHWGTHVAAAGDVLDIQRMVDRLFTEPNIYFNWLRIAKDSGYNYRDKLWYMVPEECELPMHRASSMGLAYTVETLLDQGSDPLEPSEGREWDNALTVAARNGHLDIVEFLLGKDITVNKRSVMAMMSDIDHKNHGKAKLEAIVNRIWDSSSLFDESKTPDKIIDERIIIKVMGNYRCALELMRLLLNRRHEACIPMTDEVLCDAIVLQGKKMIELLFEKCNEDIHIGPSLFATLNEMYSYDFDNRGGVDVVLVNRATELAVEDCSVACWAHHASSKAMSLMLQTHREIRVIGETLMAAASNPFGTDMIRLLLDKREPETRISERILLAAAKNHKFPEILRFLLDKLGPAAPMTQRMILTAAEEIVGKYVVNRLGQRDQTLKVLIEEISPDTVLTDKVSEGVVMNGLAMVRLVIDKQQAGFIVSEKMMEIAAASWKDDSVELLQLLMTNGGAEVPITEGILCAAASNIFCGASVMEYLLQVQEDSFPITENVLIAAAKSPDALEIILNKFPEARITDSVFVAACEERDAMLMLLSKPHNGLPIEAIMTKIGESYVGTPEVLELLVDRHLMDVDAWAVETVASSSQHLEFLLSKKPDVLITQQALVRATEDCGSLHLLLKAEKNHDLVAEEVMMAAAKHGAEIIRSILHRVESAPLTANVLKEAMCHGRKDTVRLILAQSRDLNLKANLGEIWHDVDLPGWKKGSAVIVVGELTDFKLTESLLQDYSYDKEQKDDDGFDSFDHLISTLCFYHAPIPATEGVGVIVLERCHHEVAETFLRRFPEIPITDTMLQAVERNPRVDKEALRSLLAGKRGSA
ncbi:hypothetical protein ANOM_003719 [Aspergillus nomiae NRRL 13137]|uniref:Uncharacterized protein n=1 Tax=Aspergillus nomiae NRRL (strain ATCC 15546 / NRRL 13137 / CBS 260.88 / M93) TaxID=1509407 RepID=A0A0L1JAP6_ASPN3|nr:uncharacterized protein ANOM_003719 [Aspergillus nomiae NRRL 13137]KNG88866.1 hypothetical protein ANOM_003719 [Aspergillus nomiae NRRL 13137]